MWSFETARKYRKYKEYLNKKTLFGGGGRNSDSATFLKILAAALKEIVFISGVFEVCVNRLFAAPLLQIHAHYELKKSSRHRRNLAITGGVALSVITAPVIAAVSVGKKLPVCLRVRHLEQGKSFCTR